MTLLAHEPDKSLSPVHNVLTSKKLSTTPLAKTLLVYFTGASLLAIVPSAPAHLYLGPLYYLKDISVILAMAAFVSLAIIRKDYPAIAVGCVFGGFELPLLPHLLRPGQDGWLLCLNYAAACLRFFLAVELGMFIHRERLYFTLKWLGIALLLMLIASCAVGAWEFITQSYFFTFDESETELGAQMVGAGVMDNSLLRINGLQRGTVEFADLMATGLLLSAYFITQARLWIQRVGAGALAIASGYMLFFSTGRSNLVGGAAATFLCFSIAIFPKVLIKAGQKIILGLVVVCIFFSIFDYTAVAEYVSRHVLGDTAIGNLESSYERVQNWQEDNKIILANPIIFLMGAPLGSLLTPDIDQPFLICDNVYRWLIYHFGLYGLLFALITLVTPLRIGYWRSPLVASFYFTFLSMFLVSGIFVDQENHFSTALLALGFGILLAEHQQLKDQARRSRRTNGKRRFMCRSETDLRGRIGGPPASASSEVRIEEEARL